MKNFKYFLEFFAFYLLFKLLKYKHYSTILFGGRL